MKFISLLGFFILVTLNNSLAANPGSNYGCISFTTPAKLYTNWTNTVSSSPTNPGWTSTFQTYNDSPQVYDVIYGPVQCGQVNPSNSLTNATVSGQSTCWIYTGGAWVQGGLRTFTLGAITPCPIDDYVYILFFGIAFLGVFAIKKGKVTISTF